MDLLTRNDYILLVFTIFLDNVPLINCNCPYDFPDMENVTVKIESNCVYNFHVELPYFVAYDFNDPFHDYLNDGTIAIFYTRPIDYSQVHYDLEVGEVDKAHYIGPVGNFQIVTKDLYLDEGVNLMLNVTFRNIFEQSKHNQREVILKKDIGEVYYTYYKAAVNFLHPNFIKPDGITDTERAPLDLTIKAQAIRLQDANEDDGDITELYSAFMIFDGYEGGNFTYLGSIIDFVAVKQDAILANSGSIYFFLPEELYENFFLGFPDYAALISVKDGFPDKTKTVLNKVPDTPKNDLYLNSESTNVIYHFIFTPYNMGATNLVYSFFTMDNVHLQGNMSILAGCGVSPSATIQRYEGRNNSIVYNNIRLRGHCFTIYLETHTIVHYDAVKDYSKLKLQNQIPSTDFFITSCAYPPSFVDSQYLGIYIFENITDDWMNCKTKDRMVNSDSFYQITYEVLSADLINGCLNFSFLMTYNTKKTLNQTYCGANHTKMGDSVVALGFAIATSTPLNSSGILLKVSIQEPFVSTTPLLPTQETSSILPTTLRHTSPSVSTKAALSSSTYFSKQTDATIPSTTKLTFIRVNITAVLVALLVSLGITAELS